MARLEQKEFENNKFDSFLGLRFLGDIFCILTDEDKTFFEFLKVFTNT